MVNLVVITMCWIASAFNFFMIGLQVKYFPGNFAHNMLIMTSVDIPACLLAGYLVPRFKAKSIFIAFFALQTFAGLSILFAVDSANPGWTFLISVALAKFGVQLTFTTVWMVHPKMFPTLFGATSMGIANFVTRSIVIFAPLVAEIPYPLPMAVYTVVSLVAGFASLFLLEESKEPEECLS